MISKALLLILICLGARPGLAPEDDALQMRLPVRIFSESGIQSQKIKKEDIRLLVNGKPVEIIDLIRKKRSPSLPSQTGRHFFFYFQIKTFDEMADSMISHLATDILGNLDTLHLISPNALHSFRVGPNKIALIEQIERIIKTDTLRHSRARLALENRIKDKIQDLHLFIRENPGGFLLRTAYDRFIRNFSYDFSQYKEDFLSPALPPIQGIEALLPDLNGDRYFFYFLENRFFSFLKELNRLMQSLRQYRYRPLLRVIINFQNEIMDSNLFSLDRLGAFMLENNIMFNALLFKESEPDRKGIQENLKTICHQSGGIFEPDCSPGETIQNLKNHNDFYHEILFALPGGIEEKKIQILIPGVNEQLFYKQTYSAGEISSMLSSIPEKKINIRDIRIFRDKISFQLESYEIEKEKGFGLINVRLEVTPPQGQPVFQTENTLRATRDQTRVSIQIPVHKKKALYPDHYRY